MPLTLTARKIIVVLLPTLLFAGLTPTGAHADRPSVAELEKRIGAAAQQLEVLVEQYNDAREDLKATKMQTSHLGGRLAPMSRELAGRQDVMDELVSLTYQRTRSGPTMALFAAQDPHEFVDKLLVLHQMATEEQRAVTELRDARNKVTSTRRMLNGLAAQQRRLQTQLSTRKASVEGEIVTLKRMRAVVYGSGSRFAAAGNVQVPDYVPGPAGRVVAFAYSQLGKPYRWGAAGPNSYDCSGLTMMAWRRAGVGLPHNAARQYGSMGHVSRNQLRPGDLVFFYGPISHVGVYIGGGRMIHAPEFGENVRVSSIDTQPIHGYGRPN